MADHEDHVLNTVSIMTHLLTTHGSCHGPAVLGSCGPSWWLVTETLTAIDPVRVVGMTLSSDLSPDKQVYSICATCFYWLHQLRWVWCYSAPSQQLR